MRREAVFLDLRKLGLAQGTDWKSVQAIFSLDTAPIKKAPPVASGSILPVGERNMVLDDPLGLSKVEPFDPGVPRPILITRVPRNEMRLRVTRPVQERRSQGVASAFARSLDWLNQIHKWDPSLSAQDIYEELLIMGVSTHQDENGNGSRYDEWIKAKEAYTIMLSLGKIETTLWDGAGADLFPPIDGIKEEDRQDLVKWLEGEQDKEADIELVVTLSNGNYVIMLTEVFSEGEKESKKKYVRYRVDETPGDPSSGDEEDNVAEIVKGEDGVYRLGAKKWKIIGAFSEAVKP